MAKNKTTETESDFTAFIESVPDERKRKDAYQISDIMQSCTGYKPKMWGSGIIGFGSYHYKYTSGHEGDAPLAAFSPRKDAISLYLASNFDRKEELLQQFGKHKAGKGCIYIKKLADINIDILKEMVSASVSWLNEKYPHSS